MKNEFSKNLYNLRMQRGWSQKETAANLGISQALLSHYEKGIRECGLNFLIKASEVFNCTTDYLLGISSTPSNTATTDADNISADLKEFPNLIKSRDEVQDTVNILYSITARIGNPEICKNFNKYFGNSLYAELRNLEKLYFHKENFSLDKDLSIINAKRKAVTAYYAIIREMQEKNINVNLKTIRIKDEYPSRSKAFFNLISHFES